MVFPPISPTPRFRKSGVGRPAASVYAVPMFMTAVVRFELVGAVMSAPYKFPTTWVAIADVVPTLVSENPVKKDVAAGLKPTSKGARVSFSGDKREVRRGPFNPSELVSGYWMWNCKSLEEAISWVKRAPNPMPEDSEIEIREFYEMQDFAAAVK